jgi:hypothetical protein
MGGPYRWTPAWTPPVAPPPRRLVRRFAKPFVRAELLGAFAIVAAADVAFWSHGDLAPGGGGLALALAAAPVAMAVAARSRRSSRRLFAVAALLGLVVLRSALDPTPGTVLAGLGLLAAFALGLRSRRVFVPEIAASALTAVARLPGRVRGAATGFGRVANIRRGAFGRAAVLPIAVPALVLAAFLGVFALANPVVAHVLAVAWRGTAAGASLPSAGHVAFSLATALAALALVRPACPLPRGTEEVVGAGGEATPTALVVARNVLVVQNVLFFVYDAVDARYLWTASPPAGMSTQEYAHLGAFWLTVALVMLTAVVGVIFRGALAHDPRARTIRKLAYAWMAQGAILALGTYRRIAIHVAHSGLSDLRIVGVLGTTLVVGGVVLVAWKLRRGKTFLWLLRRQLDAFAVVSVLYFVAPTHLVSAWVNVARVGAGEYRPILHAFAEAREVESAPALLPLLDHPDPRIRQGTAALLANARDRIGGVSEEQRSWQRRDLLTWRAARQLASASGRIDAELVGVDREDATRVLLEISHVANEDRSLEEILAVPAASRRGDYESGGTLRRPSR